MVKLLKQSSISLHFAPKGVNGWTTKAYNEHWSQSSNIQTNIKPDRTKDNIFLKPDQANMASGWMTVWRLDTGSLKRFGRNAVKMVETTVQLGRRITKESEEMQIEAKRLTRAKGNVWRKRISFPQ